MRLAERRQRGVVITLAEAHLADADERAGLLLESAVGEVARVERREVTDRLVVHRAHQVEAPHGAELLAQVAEHEAEDVLGLRLAPFGVVARHPGRGGESERDGSHGERGRCDRHEPALATLRFALRKVVVAHAEQSRNQAQERTVAAIALGARIGGQRLARRAARDVGRAQRGREAVPGRIVTRGIAVYDETEDAVAAARRAEGVGLGVHPARMRGRRRAHHHQRRRVGECRGDRAAEVASRLQFVAVAEHGPEPRRHRPVASGRADQALRDPIAFEPLQQPASVSLVRVAVAQERGVAHRFPLRAERAWRDGRTMSCAGALARARPAAASGRARAPQCQSRNSQRMKQTTPIPHAPFTISPPMTVVLLTSSPFSGNTTNIATAVGPTAPATSAASH